MAIDDDFRTLVRLKYGDVDGTIFDDDQLDMLIGSTTGANLAAADAAEAAAAKFSKSVEFSVEGLSIKNSVKSENYRKLADRLRSLAEAEDAGSLGVSVLGTSTGEMDAVDSDPDRDPNRMKIGMHDYPGVMPAGDIDEGF